MRRVDTHLTTPAMLERELRAAEQREVLKLLGDCRITITEPLRTSDYLQRVKNAIVDQRASCAYAQTEGCGLRGKP